MTGDGQFYAVLCDKTYCFSKYNFAKSTKQGSTHLNQPHMNFEFRAISAGGSSSTLFRFKINQVAGTLVACRLLDG
jgi:hypothetical protein